MVKTISVALLGNPNTGKSSVFNTLTGLKQTVGNYPGVTVEKKIGSFAYIQIGTTNTMKSRSVPAIALILSNDNGGHYFLNIEINIRMHSYISSEVPIPESAIKGCYTKLPYKKSNRSFQTENCAMNGIMG